MPSCSQESVRDFRNDYQCNQFQGTVGPSMPTMPTMPSCSQQNQTMPAKKKKNHNRRVSFDTQDHIREIPTLREYTRKEIGTLYMSRDEMNQSHEECWKLVDLMNSGIEYEDHEQFSKRGLVDLTDGSVERRRKMRDQAYQIVFGVQQFHSNNRSAPGCMNVGEITAVLYYKAAAQAREEAYEAAWFDAVAVRM